MVLEWVLLAVAFGAPSDPCAAAQHECLESALPVRAVLGNTVDSVAVALAACPIGDTSRDCFGAEPRADCRLYVEFEDWSFVFRVQRSSRTSRIERATLKHPHKLPSYPAELQKLVWSLSCGSSAEVLQRDVTSRYFTGCVAEIAGRQELVALTQERDDGGRVIDVVVEFKSLTETSPPLREQ